MSFAFIRKRSKNYIVYLEYKDENSGKKIQKNMGSFEKKRDASRKLNELKESDRTIVIVSHSLDALKKLCTRAIWIHDGHIREDGNVTKVIDHYLKECEWGTKCN